MRYKEIQALLRRRFNIPKEYAIRRAINSFTHAEKTVFYFFTTLFILSGVSLVWNVSEAYLTSVPIKGGTLIEGVVGNPRFINPVLALSEADKNLTTLVYSGPVRLNAKGEAENDLAAEISISDDKKVYTVTLDDNALFHDSTPVTADDIIFTIGKIIDPIIKSPKRGNWEGVTMEKVDDRTVKFTLKKAYTPFIYNLTTGILPKHIWKNVSDDEFSFSQFNTLPVGSGPYQVERVERNQGGIPDYYKFKPFKDTLGQEPYIKNLVFRFYPSEASLVEAYNKGDVESLSGISPEKLSTLHIKGGNIIQSPLPRIFAVFFNQSKSKVLLQKEVRQALNESAPKEYIVTTILGGYGTSIEGPLPAGVYSWAAASTASSTDEENVTRAKEILLKAGWKLNESTRILEKKLGKDTMSLSFSISTGDAPELRKVAEELVNTWSKLGAKIELLVFETGELNQSVIRPRHFDALLFGEVVGRDTDLYPFWHSSQRNDPGLNIALYANPRTDKFLEEARSSNDSVAAEKSYKAFQAELGKDVPAVFLYSPSFLYLVPDKLKAVTLGSLAVSQDRFISIRNWYIETDKIWQIFLN
ncbi:MAG: peptide ABC transporter substrate-binding protein [Candidatus Zambryskibacteria bacterium]|nr:peptide ABC transporter substrate-binding protein [Candidatus Zambryskibacteria bacterium]